jgi:hydroxymethylpyrimidine pyrophosphatase-like HAD family hydrolase
MGGKTGLAMRYLAFASSFDETIAGDGKIPAATLAALRRLVASGRQLILLSRRPVEQLAERVPTDLFACVVAEYGGLLRRLATGETRPLASERRPHLRRWSESELSEGVDDESWRHHLERGDYSAWMRAGISDETLASQVAAIEREAAGYGHPVHDSRRRIFAAIRERYLAGRA